MKKIKDKQERKSKDSSVEQKINPRGRYFEGKVIRKFNDRLTIHFERLIYLRKYERYEKRKTKLQARIPTEMRGKIEIGDYIEIGECKPISKSIHFIVTKKIGGIKDEGNISKNN